MTLAERWTDAADRFLSALFHALRDGIPLADGDSDYVLSIEAMPSDCHKAIFRAMVAHAEVGIRPTQHSLRRIVAGLGSFAPERILNPYNHDLVDLLPRLTGSAAHLHVFGRRLILLERKARQMSRLWRVLRDHAEGAADETPSHDSASRGFVGVGARIEPAAHKRRPLSEAALRRLAGAI